MKGKRKDSHGDGEGTKQGKRVSTYIQLSAKLAAGASSMTWNRPIRHAVGKGDKKETLHFLR